MSVTTVGSSHSPAPWLPALRKGALRYQLGLAEVAQDPGLNLFPLHFATPALISQLQDIEFKPASSPAPGLDIAGPLSHRAAELPLQPWLLLLSSTLASKASI